MGRYLNFTVFLFLIFAFSVNADSNNGIIEAFNKHRSEMNDRTAFQGNKVEDLRGLKHSSGYLQDHTNYRLCHNDELDYLTIQHQVLEPIRVGLLNKSHRAFQSFTTEKFKGTVFPVGVSKTLAKTNSLQIRKWREFASDKFSSKKAFLRSLKTYLAEFSEIEDIHIEGFKYWSPKAWRSESESSMQKIDVYTRLDIRGKSNKVRRNDVTGLNLRLVKVKGNWKIESAKLAWGSTKAKYKPHFRDASKMTGMTKVSVYERNEAIRRGGYALATGDINNDGYLDMYVGQSGPAELYTGTKSAKFKRVSDKQAGLEKDTMVKSAVFADFDNDGDQDLFLVRFIPTQKDQNDYILYRNNGKGKFKKADEGFANLGVTNYPMPIAVADFNKDGLLDIYIGFPGAKDFTNLSDGDILESGKKLQGILLNNGNGSFKDYTKTAFAKIKKARSNKQNLYPHSSLASDIDSDGDMDIIVMDDRGNISPIYVNNGKAQFTEKSAALNAENYGFGMGVAAGDLDSDGTVDIAMTNVNFLANQRIRESCIANWRFHGTNMKFRDFRLFMNSKNGQYREMANPFGRDWYGEGLAGIEFVDYDNDGDLDVYVSNGLWTGESRTEDISSLFARSWGLSPANFNELKTKWIDSKGRLLSMSMFMAFLKDYSGSLHGDKKSVRPGMSGFQRNRLYQNDGQGQFTEVGYLEGVDSIADGYMISVSDYNKDGRMDLILRNGDPGTSAVHFPAVQVYRNVGPKGKKSITLQLEGTKSNKDGIGVHVTAHVGKKKIVRILNANNGTVQSERLVHIGLGQAKVADQIQLKWPSGVEMTLKNVKPGFHRVIEKLPTNFVNLEK